MIFAVGIHILPPVVLNFLSVQLCEQGKVTEQSWLFGYEWRHDYTEIRKGCPFCVALTGLKMPPLLWPNS